MEWFLLIIIKEYVLTRSTNLPNDDVNCFYGMVDRRKALSLISSRDHCQRFLTIMYLWHAARYEPAQNLSSGSVEWTCVVVIITTPRRHLHQGANRNLPNRNLPTSCFWLKRDAQILLLTLWLEVQKQPFADLKNFVIFTRKHLWWSLYLTKLQTSRLVT